MHLAKRLHRAAVEGVDLLKLDAFDAHLLDELGEDAGVGLDGGPRHDGRDDEVSASFRLEQAAARAGRRGTPTSATW